jgi:aryl-alcohol dehydrogenase
VSSLKVGGPVVLSFDACGHCESCQDDHPAYCHDFVAHNFLGQRPDGSTAWHGDQGPVRHAFFGQSSFATRSVCRASNVVKLKTDADLELMGPLGCGLQTAAGPVPTISTSISSGMSAGRLMPCPAAALILGFSET